MLKIGNISNLLSAQYYYSSTANLHYVIPYLCALIISNTSLIYYSLLRTCELIIQNTKVYFITHDVSILLSLSFDYSSLSSSNMDAHTKKKFRHVSLLNRERTRTCNPDRETWVSTTSTYQELQSIPIHIAESKREYMTNWSPDWRRNHGWGDVAHLCLQVLTLSPLPLSAMRRTANTAQPQRRPPTLRAPTPPRAPGPTSAQHPPRSPGDGSYRRELPLRLARLARRRRSIHRKAREDPESASTARDETEPAATTRELPFRLGRLARRRRGFHRAAHASRSRPPSPRLPTRPPPRRPGAGQHRCELTPRRQEKTAAGIRIRRREKLGEAPAATTASSCSRTPCRRRYMENVRKEEERERVSGSSTVSSQGDKRDHTNYRWWSSAKYYFTKKIELIFLVSVLYIFSSGPTICSSVQFRSFCSVQFRSF
jgi:hypothetical protein